MKNRTRKQISLDVKFIKDYMASEGFDVNTPIAEAPRARELVSAMKAAIEYARNSTPANYLNIKYTHMTDAEKRRFNNRVLALKNKILEIIPKGKVPDKTLIETFEEIDKIGGRRKTIYLFELESVLYKTKDPDFKKMNTYFKKVNKVIRKHAEKSEYFERNLEGVAMNNYRADSGYYYGKTQMINAYNETLDYYDPNITQSEKKAKFNWNGFWSLISIKNGLVTGCWLGDTMDRDIFHAAIKKKKNSFKKG